MSWPVMRAIIAKDVIAVRRSKAVVIPMLAVPAILMILLPLGIGRCSSDSSVLRSFSPAKASAASTADTIRGTIRNRGAKR